MNISEGAFFCIPATLPLYWTTWNEESKHLFLQLIVGFEGASNLFKEMGLQLDEAAPWFLPSVQIISDVSSNNFCQINHMFKCSNEIG